MCVVHKTKLNVGTGCNTRNLKRGSELVISSKDDEWAIWVWGRIRSQKFT